MMRRKKTIGALLAALVLISVASFAQGQQQPKYQQQSSPQKQDAPVVFPFFNRVFVANITTEYGEAASSEGWWGIIAIYYKVVALGRHNIQWVVEYNVTTSNIPLGLWNQTGFFSGNSSTWLFNIAKRPIIHPKEEMSYAFPFLRFLYGGWWCRLYVDGILKDQMYMYKTHR